MSTIIITPDKPSDWDKIVGVGYSFYERDCDKEKFIGHILRTDEMWTTGQQKELEEVAKKHLFEGVLK